MFFEFATLCMQYSCVKMCRYILLLTLLSTIVVGCAGEQRLHRTDQIPDEMLASCRKVALEAAAAPEMWQQLKGVRLTHEPLKLDLSNVKYEFYCDSKYRVHGLDVIIPSGIPVLRQYKTWDAWMESNVRVRMDLTTESVRSMNEEVEPKN